MSIHLMPLLFFLIFFLRSTVLRIREKSVDVKVGMEQVYGRFSVYPMGSLGT